MLSRRKIPRRRLQKKVEKTLKLVELSKTITECKEGLAKLQAVSDDLKSNY